MEHALTEESSLDDSRNRRLNPNLKTSCAAAKEAKENCGIVLCLLARQGNLAPQRPSMVRMLPNLDDRSKIQPRAAYGMPGSQR